MEISTVTDGHSVAGQELPIEMRIPVDSERSQVQNQVESGTVSAGTRTREKVPSSAVEVRKLAPATLVQVKFALTDVHPKAATRTSCDYCGTRKRKCDGNGERPCSLCTKKRLTCVYSKKLPNKSRTRSKGHDTKSARTERRQRLGSVATLKRCRLSASPATGLVGMQENSLLSKYFKCLGFMPLTQQSTVREAVVRILTAPTASSQLLHASSDGSGGADGSNATLGRELGGSSMDAANGAISCTLWCAVAFGGLVEGRPRAAVDGYIWRAKAALDTCASAVTLQVARSWLQMALVHAHCGDRDNFREYVGRASRFLDGSRTEGSFAGLPQDFVEMVWHTQGMRMYLSSWETEDNIAPFIRTEIGPTPEVGDFVTEKEMCRFVFYGARRAGHAFVSDMLMRSMTTMERQVKQSTPESTRRDYGTYATLPEGNTFRSSASRASKGLQMSLPLTGNQMLRTFRELMPVYERMEHAADRPCVRTSIGGLIINTALCFSKAAKGDMEGALERASRCVEVFVSFPGLLMFDIGVHNAHLMLMISIRGGSTTLYERLRAAYNMHHREGRPVPPMEEWKGVSTFCDHAYCGTYESLILELDAASTAQRRRNEDLFTVIGTLPQAMIGNFRGPAQTAAPRAFAHTTIGIDSRSTVAIGMNDGTPEATSEVAEKDKVPVSEATTELPDIDLHEVHFENPESLNGPLVEAVDNLLPHIAGDDIGALGEDQLRPEDWTIAAEMF